MHLCISSGRNKDTNKKHVSYRYYMLLRFLLISNMLFPLQLFLRYDISLQQNQSLLNGLNRNECMNNEGHSVYMSIPKTVCFCLQPCTHILNAYLKWITSKDLMCSTWNSAQCYVAPWIGGELGGKWINLYGSLSPFDLQLKLSQQFLLITIPQYKIKF